MVEEIVVGDVDEELRAGRMRVHGTSHGDAADLVGQAVVGFVLDRCASGLLLHARLETAALDHEVVDHAVEDGVVVVAAFHVLLEVRRGFRGFLFIELQGDDAMVGMQLDHVGNPLCRENRRPVRGLTASAMISALICPAYPGRARA